MSTAHTIHHRMAVVAFAALAVVGALAPAAAATDLVANAREVRVERSAYIRLGPEALGCAIATSADSPVVLKVTDKNALPAARRIAARERFPVVVRLIPRRYGLQGLAPVFRALEKAAEGRGIVAITRDHEATRPDTCGSALIHFGAENTAWAVAQQRRFGGDRVTLKFVEPGGRIPV